MQRDALPPARARSLTTRIARGALAATLVPLALTAATAGCGEELPPPTRRDGGAADGSTRDGAAGDAGCQVGQTYCQGSNAYQCDAMGRPVNRVACEGATPMCVPGVGCVACEPNASRCDPASPQVTQRCALDGSRWVAGETCQPENFRECRAGACVDPCADSAGSRSYLGCEYWPVTTINNNCLGELGGTFPFAIAIANPQARPVSARVDGGALAAPITRTIMPGALEVVELPWVTELSQIRMRNGTSVLRAGGAYHVRTNAPVTVYQFNPLNFQVGSNYSFSNDASLLLPTGVLSGHYTVLTYPGMTFSLSGMGIPSGGFAAIVGVGDGEAPTTVNVTLSGATIGGPGVTAGTRGQRQTYALRRGDVVQLLGGGAGNDLTGTVIEASAPVAVIAGHACTQMPVGRVAGDHLEEQLFPEEAWGRRYAVTPYNDRPGTPSVVRVIAQRANTMLTFDPPSVHAPATLGAREVLTFETAQSFVVTGSLPILVSQAMYSQGSGSGAGDPAMVYEVPIEQYRSQYTFLAPSTYTRSFVNIVGPTGATPVLDGRPVTAPATPIGGSGQAAWLVEIPAGTHTIGAEGGMPYGIKVYGVGSYTSYAYPGGLDLRVINPPG